MLSADDSVRFLQRISENSPKSSADKRREHVRKQIRASKRLEPYTLQIIRGKPHGLIKHVLTVLVFWSRLLLVPNLPSFIQEPDCLRF